MEEAYAQLEPSNDKHDGGARRYEGGVGLRLYTENFVWVIIELYKIVTIRILIIFIFY